jgi:hypothetical protein
VHCWAPQSGNESVGHVLRLVCVLIQRQPVTVEQVTLLIAAADWWGSLQGPNGFVLKEVSRAFSQR